MEKLRSIQVLRGVAACSVVVLHSHAWSVPTETSAFRLGGAGVDLFFVISGFIIASIPKRPSFFFDRMYRVYPVWLIAVLPWLIWKQPGWQEMVSSLTHWPIFGSGFVMPTLRVGWTLSFEVLFYCAAALAIVTTPALPLTIFGLCVVGGLLTNAPIFDFLGNPMIFEFLFGVLVAKLPRDERVGPFLIVGAVVLLAVSPFQIFIGKVAITADLAWSRPLFWGFPCALLVYGCLCLERWFKSSGALGLLGDASFSIYLWHILVLQIVRLNWVVDIGCAILAGIAMWWLIERPIQNARNDVRRWLTQRFVGVLRPRLQQS